MSKEIRLPRVCASRKQARDIVERAPKGNVLYLDALDTVYSTNTFAQELLSEAFHWSFYSVEIKGAPDSLISYLRASEQSRLGDYYIPVFFDEDK